MTFGCPRWPHTAPSPGGDSGSAQRRDEGGACSPTRNRLFPALSIAISGFMSFGYPHSRLGFRMAYFDGLHHCKIHTITVWEKSRTFLPNELSSSGPAPWGSASVPVAPVGVPPKESRSALTRNPRSKSRFPQSPSFPQCASVKIPRKPPDFQGPKARNTNSPGQTRLGAVRKDRVLPWVSRPARSSALKGRHKQWFKGASQRGFSDARSPRPI
jgi:hypothetical protein